MRVELKTLIFWSELQTIIIIQTSTLKLAASSLIKELNFNHLLTDKSINSSFIQTSAQGWCLFIPSTIADVKLLVKLVYNILLFSKRLEIDMATTTITTWAHSAINIYIHTFTCLIDFSSTECNFLR